MAGAKIIQIGTATFIKPDIGLDIVEGINEYLDKRGYKDVNEIIGIV